MRHRLRNAAIAVFVLLLGSSTLLGQAFTLAPGANEGYVPQGTGQKLYGNFGLNSATDPEFKIYRKYLEKIEEEPLSSAANVDDIPGEIRWTDVNQRQSDNLAGLPKHALAAPGMFIGQKNHQTEDGWVVSNPNEVLYFKPLIDTEEDAELADSNRNAFWDVRFGFMESPEDYVDLIAPNSNQTDLWTGQMNTDTVYAQIAISRNDASDIPDAVQTRMGHGGSFKLQAGDPDTEIADERGRDNYELARSTIGSEAELERTGFSNAGVAYDDPIEITWGMKLANPESADPDEARLVEFWLKTGNIISKGQFDPGDAENLPEPPNPTSDRFSDFTDEFFDWRSAKPVFFAGAQGLVAGEGNMGFFTPGDLDADGNVNLDDFNRLAADFGALGTTYSRGDITQDGTTDGEDAMAWAEVADDGVKSAALSAVQGDVGGTMYDFDGSGTTDAGDVSFIQGILGTVVVCSPNEGDLDGNGVVEFADFLALSANFGQPGDAASGDTDCNGLVEFADFLTLSSNFGTNVGGADTQSVPEPTSFALLGMAGLAIGLLRRRR